MGIVTITTLRQLNLISLIAPRDLFAENYEMSENEIYDTVADDKSGWKDSPGSSRRSSKSSIGSANSKSNIPPQEGGDQATREIEDTFNDHSKDGRIPADKIGDAIRALGYNPLQSEVQQWIESVGSTFSLNDFLSIINHCKNQQETSSREEVNESLAFFDMDGEGYLPVEQLRYLMCSVQTGEQITKTEFDELIDGIHVREGKISYLDLAEIMMNHQMF